MNLLERFETIKDVAALEAEMPFKKRLKVKTVFGQLCATASRVPDRPAISYQITSGPTDKNITYTWAELQARVTQCANFLHSVGVGKDDVVAYLLPTTHETLVTLMGAMTVGKVAPINPTLEPEKISALLSDLKAKVVVTLKGFPKTNIGQLTAEALRSAPTVETVVEIDMLGHLSGLKSAIVPLIRPKVKYDQSNGLNVVEFNAALDAQNSEALDFKEDTTDRFCALFHTGGTTGLPKFAQHRQSGILYNGWLGATLLMDETDCVFCPMPLFHVFAAYPAWLSCLSSGAHMVMPTPAGYRGDGVFENFWKLIERYKVTFVITVPTAAARLMQVPVDADISSLKNAFSGSAPLPVELFKRFQNTTSVQIVEGYGMTESTCLISCNPIDGERKIGSVGLRLPYSEVQILHFDESGKVTKTCKADEVGEICVASPGVVYGNTYTDPRKNKQLYAKRKFMRTGDLGRIDKDSYIWITGRAKDIIVRSGHNIDPATIEEALAKHPEVAFTGAIGQPCDYAGELPCAYVELVEGASVSQDELMAFANKKISDPAARLKYLEVVDVLPKTAVGKTFKPELRMRAITRVYNGALEKAGLDVRVVEVLDSKSQGLVAQVSTSEATTKAKVTKVLGDFVYKWEWAKG